MTASAPVPDDHGGMLRRELRFWEAIALSIAIMTPTAAMALNGTVPASLAITVVFPGLTRNIGARLAAREGLAREA